MSHPHHLSELSVQLRRLQSEKNEQANEIDRLERQVRILSELKGINITDLQDALRAACEAEAHGELRALVGKLQSRIDVLELGGGQYTGRMRRGGALDDNEDASTRFNQEAAARARLTLELRIGELEEVESTLRAELDSVYKNSQSLTERNTNLETQLLQQRAQLEEWERRWKAKEEEETKRNSVVPVAMPSAGSYNYSEFSTTTNNVTTTPSPAILLHNAPQSQVDAESKQRALTAEAALAGEKEQRSLLESQLASAQKSYELKIDQMLHRIQFLEGQLHDLEQQLSSLYAAFGIMQGENKEERIEKEAWKRTLLESDAARAKEETEKEMSNRADQSQRSKPKNDGTKRRSLTKLLSTPSSIPKAAVKPAAHPPIAKGLLLLLLDKDDQPMSPTPSLSNPRPKSFSARKLPLKLHKSSSEAGLKFKRQYVVLHGANGLYQIRYGDSYTGQVAGVHEFITAGVSSIDVRNIYVHD